MFFTCASRLMLVAICLCVTVLSPSGASLTATGKDGDKLFQAAENRFPDGDPRRCLLMERDNGFNLRRLNVLPGSGWDNLRNVEQGGQVVILSFSQCRTTDDGRFLVPDSVSAVPILSSSVQTSAELIDNMQEWTSSTSLSINVGANIPLEEGVISGKMSTEHQDMKKKQIGDKTVTTRAQVRYVRYAVQLQPDTPLHPVFKGRLLDIAAAHQLNETKEARYLSQLLVRDFGTHVITGAVAGAALQKIDHLDKTWVKQNEENKLSIKASAGVSFFKLFSVKIQSGYSSDQSVSSDYEKYTSSSQIVTHGGPVYEPNNFTADMWAENVDQNLVFLDRSGDPLHYLVTAAVLPELPVSTLQEVAGSVQKAVETYYTFNAMPGCTDPGSDNFAPVANFDDGTCKPASNKIFLGGLYQTCEMLPGSNNGDLCGGMSQVNPMTGQTSCPAEYQPILLHQGSMSSGHVEHKCSHFLFVTYDCHDDHFQSSANYEIYWCVANQPIPDNSGYLFGGLYTSHVPNPVTQKPNCPPNYQDLKVGAGSDLHVCVSDDFEFGKPYAASFAGFLSCSAGNPLSLGPNSSSLNTYLRGQPGSWPKKCPDGYSKHLATVDQDCEINYCVQTHTFNAPQLPPIRRPPFKHRPSLPTPPGDNQVIFDRVSRTWHRNQDALQYLDMMALQPSSQSAAAAALARSAAFTNSSGMSSSWSEALQMNRSTHTADAQSLSSSFFQAHQMGKSVRTAGASTLSGSSLVETPTSMSTTAVAGLSIAGTLASVLLVVAIVLVVRRYRRRGKEEYRPLEGQQRLPQTLYGSGSEGVTIDGEENYQ